MGSNFGLLTLNDDSFLCSVQIQMIFGFYRLSHRRLSLPFHYSQCKLAATSAVSFLAVKTVPSLDSHTRLVFHQATTIVKITLTYTVISFNQVLLLAQWSSPNKVLWHTDVLLRLSLVLKRFRPKFNFRSVYLSLLGRLYLLTCEPRKRLLRSGLDSLEGIISE